MHCIVCSDFIEVADEDDELIGGTYFITYGGNGMFDPINLAYLEVFICDDCLLRAAGVGDVMRATVTDADVSFELWHGVNETKRH